ncbi:WD40-repeat-containing domain protein [Fomitopsis serialis]|uniref:WD40-repeat-containing domain protein n=1 Tax=Fomitopsis serialis TaxID=139415 RepID=UPI002008361C|nr:WD40-repeat-containing domain protein [Neoantrodia serialis]KAH9918069.1 WD40-repeat-containing domain protein [Neoantrodia serialis]
MTSHPNELTAWNVYANQLLMLGHGYPLWDPRPINCRPGVQIGDVGYISNGAFIRLFNAMASEDDALNAQRGVPNNHNPFTMGNRAAVMDVPDAIVAGTLCSKTIRQLGGKIEGQVLNSGASVAFECTDEQGAVLVLTDAAHRQQLPSRRMMNYLKQNIREWYTFATSDEVDLPLQKEDIVFVFGFVKTTQWAVASYVEGGRSARFSFNGGYGSAQASISAFATVGNSRAPAHNWGPKHQAGPPLPPQPGPSSRRRARSGRHNEPVAGPSADTQGSEADQCVFLQYYKMKYRLGLWPTVMRGAAGYDELPRGPDDPSTGGPAGTHDDVSMMDDEFVEQLPGHKTYDPADDILDYILKTPDATMAVATDSDIVRLCRKHNCDIPNDIPAFLDNVRPIVDINEDGLGILYFEDEAVPAVDPGELQKAEEPTTEPMRHEAQPEDDTPHAPGDDDFLDYPEEPESRKQDATAVLDHQAGGITALAYSNDGRLLASGSDDAFIEIWNVNTQQRIRTCEGHTQSISSLAFSPDGRELVSGSDDGLAIVWSTRTGERRFDLADHANDIYFVAYSPDGTIIATSSVDCTIRLWNARTGQRMAVLEGHGALVMLVSFSSDGRLLASASADFTACVWHVRTGQEVSKLRGHTGVVYSLAFAPDNRRLVTAAEDGTARIWKADTGEELVTLREHSGPVWAAVFSDDGQKVISGASDGTVKVCDSFGGELLLSLETGDMLVNAVAFSSDGSRVCASAEDNSIRVWSTMSGQQLTTLTGHEDKITHLKFSPDGKRIVSSSDDGMLRLWDLERMGVQPGIAV